MTKIRFTITSAGRWSGKIADFPVNGRVGYDNRPEGILRQITALIEANTYGYANAARGGRVIAVDVPEQLINKAKAIVQAREAAKSEKEQAVIEALGDKCPECGRSLMVSGSYAKCSSFSCNFSTDLEEGAV